jgi:phosphatidylglycerol lysyltransferase
VAGLLLGPRLAGTAGRRFHAAATVRELRVLAAVVVTASAVGPVLAALDAEALGPLSYLQYVFTAVEPQDPAEVRDLCTSGVDLGECLMAQVQQRTGAAAIFMAVIPSFLLLVFAAGLRRGRRAGWLGAVLVYGVMSVAAGVDLLSLVAVDGEDSAAARGLAALDFGQTVDEVVPLVVPMLLFAALLLAGPLFTVQAPPGTYRRLVLRVGAVALAAAAVYVSGASAMAGGFSPRPDSGRILADVPDRFLPLGYVLGLVPAFIPATTAAALLYEGIGVLFWLAAAGLLLRSFSVPALTGNQPGADQARALLQASGGSNLAWMTTWSGNDYWFSPSGRSFIAYRVSSSVALTVGGPVGPEEEVEDVVDGFAAFCAQLGWIPCFYSVADPVRQLTGRRGWGHVQVAEETVLDLHGLSFSGKKFQDVRTALNRADRDGIRAEWYSHVSAPRSIIKQIRAIDEEWVADRGLPEMGFTLGGLTELADPQVRILAAVDGEDRVHGVCSWLPVYRQGRIAGWTLDYMRRLGNGFRPTMEFLIASAALQLKAEGYGFISLSGAPLARTYPAHTNDGSAAGGRDGTAADPSSGAPMLDSFLDRLGSVLEPVYSFRSLMAFKDKFQPSYQPLFLAYPDSAALPRIGNAVARAYLPEVSVRQKVVLLQKVLDRKS